MPEPRRQHSGVEILDARRIRLIEGAAPQVSPEHRLDMDRVWGEAVDANPALFDGPIVVCSGVTWDDPDTLVLTWVAVTYRYRALRHVPGVGGLSALFVSVVQPSTEGGLLVGRMAPWTVSPHRWQLPGGAVEPPGAHEVFDEAALRRHAARELVEETGIETLPDDLALFTVVRGEHGHIGIIFRAPPRPASALRDQFAAVVAVETAAGRDPELEEIAFLDSQAGLANLAGPQVDYLEHVLHRHAAELPDGLHGRDALRRGLDIPRGNAVIPSLMRSQILPSRTPPAHSVVRAARPISGTTLGSGPYKILLEFSRSCAMKAPNSARPKASTGPSVFFESRTAIPARWSAISTQAPPLLLL